MKNLTALKLTRAIAIAYIKVKNIDYGINLFANYINQLLKNPQLKEELDITRKFMLNLLKGKEKTGDVERIKALPEAFAIYQFKINSKKHDDNLLIECAAALNEIEQYDLAFEILKQVKDKKNKEYLKIFVRTNYEIKNYQKALRYLKKCLKIYEPDVIIYNLFGEIYLKLYEEDSKIKNVEKAYMYFTKAYELSKDANFLRGQIITLNYLKRNKEAIKLYKKLLKENPTDRDYSNYASLEFKTGNFKESYKYFDYRLKTTDEDGEKFYYPKFDKPMWDCETDISDKTLLVHWEQGYGDTITFCRFLIEAQKRVKKLIFIVQKPLFRLFKNNNFDFEIYTSDVDINTLEFDYHIPLFSLIKIWNMSDNTMEKYLEVNPEDVRKYKIFNIDQRAFNIGIMYNSTSKEALKFRNIPLEVFKKLLDIRGVRIYSFQIEEEFEKKEKEYNIIHLGDTFNDFYDTALAIKNMHLVITSDNVILNLAGALGKKTFGLLNSNHHFRWYKTEGEDIGWYKSVKPFVASKLNDWDRLSVYVKKEVQKHRIKLRKNFLEEYLKIEKEKEAKAVSFEEKLPSISIQCRILQTLHELTDNIEYRNQEIANHSRILEMKPDRYITMGNMATAFYLMGKPEMGEVYWNKCIDKLDDKSYDLLFNYGCFQCTNKNFDLFFKYYPYRFLKKDNFTLYPKLDKPEYKGETDVSDKTLLIHTEQGFGDTFLFIRYTHELSKLFKKIIIVTQDETKELIQCSFPYAKVLGIREFNKDEIEFDYHIPTMNMQIALNIYPTDYNKKRWLKVNEERIKDFSQYINKKKFNIGIFWQSIDSQYKRNIELESLIPLAHINKVQLYSLQIDKEDIEINYIDDKVNIVNLGKHFKNFADTAAAIENMDLIISTDSSVLNLAGALGKKTFGIFNIPHEWRWYQLEGEDVGWYKSVKPFKANTPNEIKTIIKKIAVEIKDLIKNNERFNRK